MDKEDINKQLKKLDKEFFKVMIIYTISIIILIIIFVFILNMPIMLYFLLNFLTLGDFLITAIYTEKETELKKKLKSKK